MNLYNETSFECSKLITNKYSTSFSLGIKAFDPRFRDPVYAIYGFVRCADEIVDTFHNYDKAKLIADFREDTYKAIEQKISLNPVLNSFQYVVNHYGLDVELIDAFLLSMEMDLDKTTYEVDSYKAYIFGSAEVIGLMCLKVFCEGDDHLYRMLYPKARALGSAFQKVNFLRDIKADREDLGRNYFPGVDFSNFTEKNKRDIEKDIQHDFDEGFEGIKQLPNGTRLGVYIAYLYYLQLFKKISRLPANTVMEERVRISDTFKMALYCKAFVQQKLNVI